MSDTPTLTDRIHGFVELGAVDVVLTAVASILGEYGADYLSVPMSPTGQDPATHMAGSVQVTSAQHAEMVGLMNPAAGVYGFPGEAYGIDTPETIVIVTDPANPPTPAEGQRLVWDFDAAALSLGLRRIVPKMPGVTE